MYCPKCGKELEDGSQFCAYCGAKIEEQTEYANYYTPQQAAPAYQQSAPTYQPTTPVFNRAAVSKKEFIEKYAPAQLKKNLKSMAIVCYILSAISAVTSVALTGNPLALIDVALLLGLTLGMHLGKSKGCAIALLVVSILEVILTTVTTGMPSGWWWIIASASAVSSFVKIDKAYDAFLLGEAQLPAYAQAQPFATNAQPVQSPAQQDVYYTPPQPAETDVYYTPKQPAETDVYYTPEQPAEPEATPEPPSEF